MITEIERQKIIKSILNVRCREGSTIADIESKCSWHSSISVIYVILDDNNFYIWFEKMITKRWPVTVFWMHTHTWTPLIVCIVMGMQMVNPNGMSRATTYNTLQKWFSNKEPHNIITPSTNITSKYNNNNSWKNSNDNQNRSMCSMTLWIWAIVFSKIMSSISCGKLNHNNNIHTIDTLDEGKWHDKIKGALNLKVINKRYDSHSDRIFTLNAHFWQILKALITWLFWYFLCYYRKMNSKYQQLIGMEDENNNNNNASFCNLNLNVTLSPSPPHPKTRPPIKLDAQLVGDDLFRSLVTRDTIDHHMLNRSKWTSRKFCHFIICIIFNRPNFDTFFFPDIEKKNTENGIQQIGFCVSGQTIASAAKQIELAHYFKASHLILNVGSMDILNGQSLDDMCTDFDHLIRVCEQRGCVPIVTTLAPLANNHRSMNIHDKVLAFNFYLLNKYRMAYPFIDIWQQFSMRNGQINSDFYETYAFTLLFTNFSLLSSFIWFDFCWLYFQRFDGCEWVWSTASHVEQFMPFDDSKSHSKTITFNFEDQQSGTYKFWCLNVHKVA